MNITIVSILLQTLTQKRCPSASTPTHLPNLLGEMPSRDRYLHGRVKELLEAIHLRDNGAVAPVKN
jgi:hypothetical protein